MSHPKFNALADRILQRRLDHLKSVGMKTEEQDETQLDLAFPRQNEFLDVFNRFDPVAREVEWSLYTPKGEFLLQFSFKLEDHSYVIQSIHPCLLGDKGKKDCRKAINDHLAQHYPALILMEVENQPVIQQSTSEAVRN